VELLQQKPVLERSMMQGAMRQRLDFRLQLAGLWLSAAPGSVHPTNGFFRSAAVVARFANQPPPTASSHQWPLAAPDWQRLADFLAAVMQWSRWQVGR